MMISFSVTLWLALIFIIDDCHYCHGFSILTTTATTKTPTKSLQPTTSSSSSITKTTGHSSSSSFRIYQSLDNHHHDSNDEKRRELLRSVPLSLWWLHSSMGLSLPAFAASSLTNTPENPIVVIGGGGKVGKLCTQLLSQEGIYCTCVTRTGRQVLNDDSAFVTYAAGDVTKYGTLDAVVANAAGVIFTASASGKKKGGDPAHVDYFGVYNTAKACLNRRVPKLVVVSSGCVSRPDSIGFKATNAIGKFLIGDKIMDYKIAGENQVRYLYSGQTESSYTILRPGGLSGEPSNGSNGLHISQGDVYSSEISREDVAKLCIASLLTNDTNNVTLECNNRKGLNKAQDNLSDLPSELIHTTTEPNNYLALLQGLKSDAIMSTTYRNIVSTYGGDNIEPIDQFV